MTNREAFDEQAEAMATGAEHRALVTACRHLASWCDEEPGNDKAWREYRLALRLLEEAVSDGGSDAFDLVSELRAEVRDAEDAGA